MWASPIRDNSLGTHMIVTSCMGKSRGKATCRRRGLMGMCTLFNLGRTTRVGYNYKMGQRPPLISYWASWTTFTWPAIYSEAKLHSRKGDFPLWTKTSYSFGNKCRLVILSCSELISIRNMRVMYKKMDINYIISICKKK